MNISYKLTKDDLVDGFKLNKKKPLWLQLPITLCLLLMLILMVVFGYYLFLGYRVIILPLLIIVFSLSFFIINRFVLFPRTVHKYYESSNGLKDTIDIAFSDESIDFSSNYDKQIRKWDNLYGWKEDEKYLILYTSNMTWQGIPKNKFTNPEVYNFIKGKIDETGIKYINYPPGSIAISLIYLFLLGILTYNLVTIFR